MITKKRLSAAICDLDNDMYALVLRTKDLEEKVERLEKSARKAGLLERRKPGRPKKEA